MHRTVLVCFVLFSISSPLFSYQITIPATEVVHTFGVGDQPNQLGMDTSDSHDLFSPGSVVVLENGSFLISDVVNGSTKMFDRRLNFISSIRTTAERLASDGRLVVGWNKIGGGFVSILEANGNKETIRVNAWSGGADHQLFILDGRIISLDQDLKIWEFSKGRLNEISEKVWLSSTGNDIIKLNKAALQSNKLGLISKSAATFFLGNGKPYRQPQPDSGEDDTYSYGVGRLISVDTSGRRYFLVSNDRIVITSRDATILASLKFRESFPASTQISFPGVSSSGDIYFIASTDSEHQLIRIAEAW